MVKYEPLAIAVDDVLEILVSAGVGFQRVIGNTLQRTGDRLPGVPACIFPLPNLFTQFIEAFTDDGRTFNSCLDQEHLRHDQVVDSLANPAGWLVWCLHRPLSYPSGQNRLAARLHTNGARGLNFAFFKGKQGKNYAFLRVPEENMQSTCQPCDIIAIFCDSAMIAGGNYLA